jgi:hypothetical protein
MRESYGSPQIVLKLKNLLIRVLTTISLGIKNMKGSISMKKKDVDEITAFEEHFKKNWRWNNFILLGGVITVVIGFILTIIVMRNHYENKMKFMSDCTWEATEWEPTFYMNGTTETNSFHLQRKHSGIIRFKKGDPDKGGMHYAIYLPNDKKGREDIQGLVALSKNISVKKLEFDIYVLERREDDAKRQMEEKKKELEALRKGISKGAKK